MTDEQQQEQTQEQVERDTDFGEGTYQDMLDRVSHIMTDVVPRVPFTVAGDENRSRLQLIFKFERPDNIGLFLGRSCCNLKMLQQYLRSQQIFPHDRYVQIVIDKGNGEEQVFWDRQTSKVAKRDS